MPDVSVAQIALGNAFLYSAAAIAFADHPGATSVPELKPYAARYR